MSLQLFALSSGRARPSATKPRPCARRIRGLSEVPAPRAGCHRIPVWDLGASQFPAALKKEPAAISWISARAARNLTNVFALLAHIGRARLSMASCFCPRAAINCARWWPVKLPGYGQRICPLIGFGGVGHRGVGQFSRVTPFPARAWVRRTESPLVWQTWAWCSSRSTVAVARVLGMSSSNPAGWRLELIATDRFS